MSLHRSKLILHRAFMPEAQGSLVPHIHISILQKQSNRAFIITSQSNTFPTQQDWGKHSNNDRHMQRQKCPQLLRSRIKSARARTTDGAQ
jgi:hypothetical protein